MKRKIYVASSWRNDYQQNVVKILRELGHDVYDFRNLHEGNTGFSWSQIDENWQNWTTDEYINALDNPIAQYGYKCDFEAMQWADTCVLVLPSGRSAHIEAGWFSGCTVRKLYIYSPIKQEPELMYKIGDGIISNEKDLIEFFTL